MPPTPAVAETFPAPARAISARSYMHIRSRVEKWTESQWTTPEQLILLGQWLLVEGQERQRELDA